MIVNTFPVHQWYCFKRIYPGLKYIHRKSSRKLKLTIYMWDNFTPVASLHWCCFWPGATNSTVGCRVNDGSRPDRSWPQRVDIFFPRSVVNCSHPVISAVSQLDTTFIPSQTRQEISAIWALWDHWIDTTGHNPGVQPDAPLSLRTIQSTTGCERWERGLQMKMPTHQLQESQEKHFSLLPGRPLELQFDT